MMIDFALDAERSSGLEPREAIYEACLLRFRPIMMTTMAAMLGALPLAIGFGEGAELRRPLGIAIVGGLIVSQMLTLYTTPVIYLYLDRFRLWVAARIWRGAARAVGEQRPWRLANERHDALALAALAADRCLAACTVGPDYERPDAPVPAAYKERGLEAGEPHDAVEPRRVVVDLQRPRARRARARRSTSRTRTSRRPRPPIARPCVVARGARRLLPDARGQRLGAQRSGKARGAGVQRHRRRLRAARGVQNNLDVTAEASWEPDLWGRIRRTVESDVANAQASAADLASARAPGRGLQPRLLASAPAAHGPLLRRPEQPAHRYRRRAAGGRPGRTLGGLARNHPAIDAGRPVIASLPHPSDPGDDAAFLLTAAGQLWRAGGGAGSTGTRCTPGSRGARSRYPATVEPPTVPAAGPGADGTGRRRS